MATEAPRPSDGALESFVDRDGVAVGYRRWLPDGAARAVVLVSHGASEHSGRYGRFARRLNTRGYAVWAIDHRGHGATIAATGAGRGGPRGWEGMLDDLTQLADIAEADSGGVPLVLFGHSMGSFAAQLVAQRAGDGLAGLVLSGSAGAIDGINDTIALLDAVVAEGGGDAPAPMFDTFNDAFEPVRTSFDWLSRDRAEVDEYIADPWCGDDVPLTLEFALDMLRHLAEAWDPTNEARVPVDLPVLLITGEDDPVSGGARTVRELEARYNALGLRDVTARYYAGARHELLNETNRDEVEEAVADCLDRVTDRPHIA
jgi:alpha-beta hydrolase superfamily lysophospholipase